MRDRKMSLKKRGVKEEIHEKAENATSSFASYLFPHVGVKASAPARNVMTRCRLSESIV